MSLSFSSEHAARVADPRIRSALRKWLRGRVPATDVADMVQNVLGELLSYREPPATVEGLIALGRTLLKNDLVDFYRHRQIVRAVEVRPRDEQLDERVPGAAPTNGWDYVDRKKRAEVVDELVAKGDLTVDDVDVLERADDEGYRALAEQLGTNEVALRQRASRKRKLLNEHWVRYAAAGAAGLAIVLFLYAQLREPEVAAPNPTPLPSGHQTLPPPEPREEAIALREAAARACDAAQWTECLEKLDRARALDPEGDHARRVQEMRDAADPNRRAMPSPSSGLP